MLYLPCQSLNSREGSTIQRVTGKEVRVTLQSSPARLVTIICAQPVTGSFVLGRQRAAGAWRFGDGEATRPDTLECSQLVKDNCQVRRSAKTSIEREKTLHWGPAWPRSELRKV